MLAFMIWKSVCHFLQYNSSTKQNYLNKNLIKCWSTYNLQNFKNQFLWLLTTNKSTVGMKSFSKKTTGNAIELRHLHVEWSGWIQKMSKFAKIKKKPNRKPLTSYIFCTFFMCKKKVKEEKGYKLYKNHSCRSVLTS